MSKNSKLKTKNPHESTWDGHGSYKWTYFSDEIKQRINFFLSQRLKGKNLDVGGGWYLSYPNSTVVDLSSVCLSHNPAKDKLQFDLDELDGKKHLPYENNSFDSATLISVWQYLKNPSEVVKELRRVLSPGGEIYVIGGQGAGLEECVQGLGRTNDIQKFLKKRRYDTLIENIPAFGRDVNTFQSVCVAIPDIDLFGNVPSRIRDKEERDKQNQEIYENPSIFYDNFAWWEINKRSKLLSQIRKFPITKYSQDYLSRIEEFSQDFFSKTGTTPLIFSEHSIEPELLMLTPESEYYFYGTLSLIDGNSSREFDEELDQTLKKHELGFVRHMNYFNFSTTEGLLEHCENIPPRDLVSYHGKENYERNLDKYANFISVISLNSFTKELQTQIYDKLKLSVEDLDERVERKRTLGYHFATYDSKQKRRVDKLIEAKRRIEEGGIEIVGERELDFVPHLLRMKELILK